MAVRAIIRLRYSTATQLERVHASRLAIHARCSASRLELEAAALAALKASAISSSSLDKWWSSQIICSTGLLAFAQSKVTATALLAPTPIADTKAAIAARDAIRVMGILPSQRHSG